MADSSLHTLIDVEVSRDVFFRNRFEALQPRDRGHRSGSDALLIAACLPQGVKGKISDLGAGAGVAGMAAAIQNPGLEVTLVENDPVMARIARKNLTLSHNSSFANRISVLEADITLSGSQRVEAGFKENYFDHAIMNPPYNHRDQRPSPDPLRAKAHSMGLFGLDCWMRTAVAVLKPGGRLVMIYRTEKLADVFACAQGRFGHVSIVPVHSKPNQAAKRILLSMIKGSKSPLSILPGITLHDKDGSPSRLNSALMNGEARVSI